PLYNMPALTLHESYPGHALQLELAAESHGQPAFRRNGYISAYGEGWGLYSEYLGNEMGIYKTPYQQFGFLTYQMWRACRLVVDTGIHHLGWTRQQAIDYLTGNTALSDREIANEVDRYISWPGAVLRARLPEDPRAARKGGTGAGRKVRPPPLPRYRAVHRLGAAAGAGE